MRLPWVEPEYGTDAPRRRSALDRRSDGQRWFRTAYFDPMQTIRGATRNLDRIGYAQWLLRRLSRAQIRLQAAMGTGTRHGTGRVSVAAVSSQQHRTSIRAR